MSLLDAVRSQLRSRDAEASGTPESGATQGAPEPFAGYARLDARGVINSLPSHSQIELTALELYERAHQQRVAVLDKLRYMRCKEPVEGYDAMDENAIVTLLGTAKLPLIKRVRTYERKFANRRAVLEEVLRVHHIGLANRPKEPVPAYQPGGVAPTET